MMKSIFLSFTFFFAIRTLSFGQVTFSTEDDITYRTEISQYGITWTFDRPVKAGQFITGDWWVVGPVRVVKISPEPGPIDKDESEIKVNHWDDTSLKVDTRMRNGSMIVLEVGTTHGYDSRSGSYREEDRVNLPIDLRPNLSLVSSISNLHLPVDQFSKDILWESEQKSQTIMKAAAVLTCLERVPPADSFRPPYAGTEKPIFSKKDIRWELLPRLEPAGEVPSWEKF